MSQINTNTIANELGTGGPDFVGMPTVGGDPVVESGSNTDGEWTRWADGTQHCMGAVVTSAVIASGGDFEYIWTYPQGFIAQPIVSADGYVKSGSPGNPPQFLSRPRGAPSTTTATVSFYNNSPVGLVINVTPFATGRWK